MRTWRVMTLCKLGTLAVMSLALAATPLPGQEAPRLDEPVQAHPEGDAAISRLRSPYCPGLMLEVCPSPQAKLLRDSLQVMAHEGMQSDSIVSWMLGSYGEEYRAVPQTRGGGLFAWIVPPLALLLGLVLVMATLRHFKARRDAASPPAEPLSEEDEAVLAEALEDLKSAEEVPF